MLNKLNIPTKVFSFMCLSSSLCWSAVTAQRGDLVAAFFEVNATGTGVEANTYVLNLGSASALREGTLSYSQNISTDLASAFGADWFTSGSVRWAVVSVIASTDPVTNGDPGRTTYISVDNGGTQGSAAPTNLSSTQRGTLSTNLSSFFAPIGMGLDENGATNGGAIYPSSSPNSVTSFLPPSSSTNFGLGQSPTAGINGMTSSLDIFRTLHTTTGADLTAALGPDATTGSRQYVGSFQINSSGQLSLASVPEPTSSLLLGALAALGLLKRKRHSH
jgi:hypothetical protein